MFRSKWLPPINLRLYHQKNCWTQIAVCNYMYLWRRTWDSSWNVLNRNQISPFQCGKYSLVKNSKTFNIKCKKLRLLSAKAKLNCSVKIETLSNACDEVCVCIFCILYRAAFNLTWMLFCQSGDVVVEEIPWIHCYSFLSNQAQSHFIHQAYLERFDSVQIRMWHSFIPIFQCTILHYGINNNPLTKII